MRSAEVTRNTLETKITVKMNLDGAGKSAFRTGVPFLEHMLDQVARHGLIDLDIEGEGDLHIDAHHTAEDIGITLGQAFTKALGDKKGIRRYGHAYVPLDEALSRVVIDLSGRPGLDYSMWNSPAPASATSTWTCSANSSRASSTMPASPCISTLPARRQRPPSGRNRVQGLRPRPAHGRRGRSAHGR
jgi:imidazoleglycerol phosphate dehydratase HisB